MSSGWSHSVFVPLLFWVIRLPPAGREDVLVALVPVTKHHLTSMRLHYACTQTDRHHHTREDHEEWVVALAGGGWSHKRVHSLMTTYLVFLHIGVSDEPHVVMHVKAEKWPRLASSLVDDKVVEGMVLQWDGTEGGSIGQHGKRSFKLCDSGINDTLPGTCMF